MLQLVDYINQLLGTCIAPEFHEPRPGDILHSFADITTAQQWGYVSTTPFLEGLRDLLEWYGGRPTLDARRK